MEKNVFYTKGDRDEVIKRMNQIHTITLYCPLIDPGVEVLYELMGEFLKEYCSKEGFLWKNVSTIDAFNIFFYATTHCKKNNIDLGITSILAGTLKSFPKLKYINFEFTPYWDIFDTYSKLKNKTGVDEIDKERIFKVNSLELNLMDLFSQNIIDMINKVMIMNEIIPNSYLERKFKIDFKYDEYISFMDMFLGNNGPMLNQLDKNICDYFITFPDLIVKQKPDIRMITNYRKL